MHYIKAKAVKQKLHEKKYQITPEALNQLDVKFDDFLNRLMKQWNGHHKRITPELVELVQVK